MLGMASSSDEEEYSSLAEEVQSSQTGQSTVLLLIGCWDVGWVPNSS